MSRGTSIVPFLGILAIFFITVKPAVALTAYECGGKVEKLTSISLIDVTTEECYREIDELTNFSFQDFGSSKAKLEVMYRNVQKRQCALQKEILKNKLALASTDPEEFAFQLMGGPGYTAIVAGEVVHVMKCGPVAFQVRRTNKCYDRLPIRIEGKEMFVKPRSRIITEHAAELPCNRILQEHYKLEGTWYKFNPNPIQAPLPLKLKLGSEVKWTDKIVSLVNSGIIRQEDLDQMKNRVMPS